MVFRGLLISLLFARSLAAPTTLPQVNIQMERQDYFVGEIPQLIVNFPCAEASARDHLLKKSVFIKFLGPDGRTEIDGYAANGSQLRWGRFFSGPDQPEKAIVSCRMTPWIAGKYTVKIESDDGTVKELSFQAREFEAGDIKQRFSVELPVERHVRPARRTLELLHVKLAGEYKLFYRLNGPDMSLPEGVCFLTPLWPMDANSKILDVAFTPDAARVGGEAWIRFEQDGKKFLGRVGCFSGEVFDVSLLDARDRKD